MDEIQTWRNIANHGRGSQMTEALHQACDSVDRLTAERDSARRAHQRAYEELQVVRASREQAQAMLERYREALEEIANWSVDDPWLNNTTHCRSGLEDSVNTARDALKGEQS